MSAPERSLQQRSDRLGLKVLGAVVILTALVYLWNSNRLQPNGSAPDTWVDMGGHLHVLGITLGETDLRQAETILQSRSDIALYIYPQGHPRAGKTVEAFFPAIADHTKVILELDADLARLDDLESRATIPHLYPNEVARMNLALADLEQVRRLTVKQLTLIPSITLDGATLKARFGEPSEVIELAQGGRVYRFQEIGLQATIDGDQSAQLRFANP